MWGITQETIIGLIKGDTRSLDYGSYKYICICVKPLA